MRSIAVINQKGGVGKTTTVTNLAAALAGRGYRVLAVDLDPQAHLTIGFAQEPAQQCAGIYSVLTESTPLETSMLQVAERLWLVPSHIDLAGAEIELVSVVGREVILRDALAPVRDRFDFVLIDCPPSLGVLTINALAAVEEVFIPLQPHFFALQGLGKLLDETIRLVAKRINPDLRVTGVVFTMYEGGTRLAGEIFDDVRSFFDAAAATDSPWSQTRVFETVIRRNIKLAEAPSHGLTIFDYAPRSHGALDYERLALEVLGELAAADEERTELASVVTTMDDATNEPEAEPNLPDSIIGAAVARDEFVGGPAGEAPQTDDDDVTSRTIRIPVQSPPASESRRSADIANIA